ncbi:MAG TPA: ABC transporter permease [Candidatus Limnocylindria bacterium]|jgi:putative spermidine/putrescine transport system permease protein|nr:ABC transporter permease [Candidatus Limnocylindria bacterium]
MTTASPPVDASRARRLATWFHRRPRLQVATLLAAPLAWIGLAYLGSLAILLLNAFWVQDSFSGRIVPDFTLASFEKLFTVEVYRTIAVRTIGMALAVTLTDIVLAFPIAYYMARVASRRTRGLLVVAMLMPLWASYLVKIYAWRVILQGNGLLDWALAPFGVSGPGLREVSNSWLVLSYLWLPYMILPIYAGLERLPSSLLEASADLGARAGTTFRRVVLPLVLPAVVAGSIFTFSLTLGDYITPSMVSGTKFIGNVIYDNSSTGSLPLAAAFSFVPIVIMIGYLLVARRLGAFESL